MPLFRNCFIAYLLVPRLVSLLAFCLLAWPDSFGQFTMSNIGSPVPSGNAVVDTLNALTLSTTGTGMGGSHDNFSFYSGLRTGDFDVAAHVTNFSVVTTSSPQFAGLMARPDLTADSRHVSALVEAPNAGNSWRTIVRSQDGGGSGSWPNSYAPGQINYPDVWVRLRRQGNVFTAFSSADGTNWIKYGEISPEPAFPSALSLGLAICGVNGNSPAVANFTDFGTATINPHSNTDPQWDTFSFLAGGVKALIPDGSGGAFVGGDFTTIGGISANRVAHWDGTKWFALGNGITGGTVMALARGEDGSLYAGGQFVSPASNIAKWNGTNWVSLGSGITGDTVYVAVRALTVADDNSLYAAGAFATAGGVSARNIARWNGSAWQALGDGLIHPDAASGLGLVLSLAANGRHIHAGGAFTVAGQTPVNNVASWDGSTWSDLGGGLTSTKYSVAVNSIVCRGDEIFVGGVFSQAGPIIADGVARWDGANWMALPASVERVVKSLAVLGEELVAGGSYQNGLGAPVHALSAWSGSDWVALGRGLEGNPPSVSLLSETDGNLLVVGDFTKAGGIPAANSAIWTPTNLAPVVRITSPAPNAFISLVSTDATTTVHISASAIDADDSIARVDFFSGNEPLGFIDAAPFEFEWNNVGAGVYDLHAIATDARGKSTASAITSIQVDAPNLSPTVQINAPLNGARFNEGNNITASATAADPDGAIARVDFFLDYTNLIGSSSQPPFAASLQNARPGAFTITARATDNRGLQTWSAPVPFSVNARPMVQITSPIDGAVSINTNDLIINVSAQDPDGTVQQVSLYRDGSFIGKAITSPYIFRLVGLPPGTNVYTAVAIDNEGVSSTSVPVQVFEQEPAAPYYPPTIKFLWPTNDFVLTAPANLNLVASANVYRDNLAYILFQAAYEPLGSTPLNLGDGHSLLSTITLTNLAPGEYTVSALVRDIYESQAVSAPVKITVLPPPGTNPLFRLTDLGTLGGDSSRGSGLNNFGAAVGSSRIAINSEVQHAFLWQNGVLRDLPASTLQRYGVAINDSEMVLGTTSSSGGNPTGAFLWTPLGGSQNLPTLGGTLTEPCALNNLGQAVGWARNPAGVEMPVLWHDGVITTLPVQISGQARAINSAGQIAGFAATTEFGAPHAIVWDHGTTNDLGVLVELGGRQSFGFGINDSGVVVGQADDSSSFTHAVVWTQGAIARLPSLPGIATRASALAVNNQGQIVGQCQPLSQIGQAMLWIDGIPFDLNACVTNRPGILTTADAINDRGQIVGTMMVSGLEHAYLLTPVSLTSSNPAPTVSLASPTTNDLLVAGKTAALSATAQAGAGEIARVDFYVDNVVVATATNAPFSAAWQPATAGSVSIKAVAIDTHGGSAASATITLNVLAAPPKYQLVDLGPISATASSASGINSFGSFVGTARTAQGDFGFVYDGGIVTHLNKTTPPGTLALDINDSDQVVVLLGNQHAGLYQNGTMIDLGALPTGSGLAIPRAINNSAEIAGQSSAANGETHAVIWTNNTIVDIGVTLGQTSQANDINNAGVTVGWYQSAPGAAARVFVFDPAQGIQTFGSTIGGQDAQAWGINDTGSIVGNAADASGHQVAFLYQMGLMKSLGTLGGFNSFARGINSSNQIVGYAEDMNSDSRAFISTGNGVSDLNKLLPSNATAILTQATAINDKGQILAVGYPSPADQNLRIFLVNPYPEAGQPNQLPSVALEAPASGAVYYDGDDIPLLASAVDQDGTVRIVNFLANDTLVAASTTQPFGATWRNVRPGTYSLTAVAADNAGASQNSSPIAITVRAFDTNAPAVAILSSASPAENADVREKLRRTERFSQVNLISIASSALPTLVQLQQYDAVLVFSSRLSPVAAPAALGNLLADYIDSGHGVVLGLLTGNLNQNLIRGRFQSLGYFPWTAGQFSSHGRITMDKVVPNHPILADVNSLDGGFSAEFLDQFFLTPGSVAVSKWGTGPALAVAREIAGSRLVGLNFKPVSNDAVADGWEPSTDGALLMANSLVWAGSASSGHLALALGGTNNGSYLPGQEIALTASSANLPSQGIVRFYTNNVLLATATNLPAHFNWTNPPVGVYLISAVYSNSVGSVVVSRGLPATVNSRLSIELVSPSDNTVVYLPTNILMQVSVSDLDAPIAKVDYYLDGAQKIGTVTTPPFSFNFTQFGIGLLNISAVATDTLGASQTSAVHHVTVINTALPHSTIWNAGAGPWFAPTNWTFGPPRPQDSAIIQSGGVATIENNSATSSQLTIGSSSTGAVTHLSGSLNVTGDFVLGENSSGSGSYRLEAPGSVTAAGISIGLLGKGAFVHNGGSVTAQGIYLSGNVGGRGSYELNGGSIQASGIIVGYLNDASFRQTGGTNRVTSLEVGRGNSTIGTYELTGGALTVDFETIGSSRVPVDPLSTFYQKGGQHRVIHELRLGNQGAGILSVSGGRLEAGQFIMGTGALFDITADPATNHFHVVGKATLSGLLRIHLPPGYMPLGGDTIKLMTFGTRQGTFANVILPPSSNGVVWALEYQANAVVLQALPPPQVVLITPFSADSEANVFHRTVTLSNHGNDPMLGARIYFPDIPNGWEVLNASGEENGIPFVETDALVLPGVSVQFEVQFLNTAPAPLPQANYTLQMNSVPTAGSPARPLNVDSINIRSDGAVVLEFTSILNMRYLISYSGDLIKWTPASQSIVATGGRSQWVDNGVPKTLKSPAQEAARHYRITTQGMDSKKP